MAVVQFTGFGGQSALGVSLNSAIEGSGFDAAYFRQLTRSQGNLNWRSNMDQTAMLQLAATTDGALPGKFFETLTNSGTATLTSATAGYEGQMLSTTGAASGNTNSWIGYDAGLPVAGRLFWGTIALFLPDPNVAAYDIWFGVFNKQAAPGTTAPTDGAWFKGTVAASTLTVIGQMANNSTTASTATLFTVGTGVTTSIELGFVYQGGLGGTVAGGVDFYTRKPAAAPTFVAADQYNWTPVGGISLNAAVNCPRATIVLRPTFAHITRTAATHALNGEGMLCGIQNQPLR